MKKIKRLKAILGLSLLVTTLAIMYFVPALAQPGDANDPLVTRSFVESRISSVIDEINDLRNVINNIAPGSVHSPEGAGGSLSPADRNALFEEFLQYFDVIYGEMLRSAAANYNPSLPPDSSPNINIPELGSGDVVPFRIERIAVGSTLIAHEGAEFIVRSGMATAVTGPNGMVDITAGRDVMNGEQISHNHLLLVPRTDGRGFLANTDVYVMIKGGFDIVS